MKKKFILMILALAGILVMSGCFEGLKTGGETTGDSVSEADGAAKKLADGMESAGKEKSGKEKTEKEKTEKGNAEKEKTEKGDAEPETIKELVKYGERPMVKVYSDGETFIPIENFTSSETIQTDAAGSEQTVFDCGRWLRPEEVIGMPQVPYAGDMKLEANCPISRIIYGFYDENFKPDGEGKQEAERLDEIIFPHQDMLYYVELDITWESESGETGCQYFFKVIPEGRSPMLTVSYDKDGTMVKVPSGKGKGAFQELVQQDKLQYIPIGSWLNFDFSDGSTPVSVSLSDVILDESGNSQFPYAEEKVISLQAGTDGYSAYIDTNLNVMYFRYSEAYQPAGIIRGFLADCRFEDGRTETYAIAFKTDAAFGLGMEPSSAYLMLMCGTGIDVFTESKPQKGREGLELIFTMYSNSADDFSYGEQPMLQRFEGPELKEIPFLEGTGWNDIAYTLVGKKSAAVKVNLEQVYGPLEPGYYRFSKVITNMQNGRSQTVSADFVIN
ncbi:hypothetical protein GPL15_08630 [Clostridium sp. MCC353]|uniref:immunoglobulin-like domain-containing protein n=1 Tax=Clostridium sp. MCC353 TaxID=2592646 RepID=UPI001C01E688|nr:immunoglobulin-like domain-containing protein [Clostridium sp. MCC353]MBT9776568.1 hypothetical protein [Clostridium sp. MCC353]